MDSLQLKSRRALVANEDIALASGIQQRRLQNRLDFAPRTTASATSIVPRKTWWQQLPVAGSWTFRAALYSIRIPFVSADQGDDFSNNLATDLAPILSLFGEQVAKQYMSQSITWMEDIIFGMAPLGILTAIVSAIRVGGPPWMKAVIGRAREGKGIVELELMSSTSPDVGEMWDGERVVRVLGSSSVAQLFYLTPENNSRAIERESGTLLLPLEIDPWRLYDRAGMNEPEIYDLKSAANRELISAHKRSSDTTEPAHNPAPNLSLNLGGHISSWELYTVAIIGIVIQAGVIVFAGLGHLPGWKEQFRKEGRYPDVYALPCMTAGTVALVIGMIMCSYLVQRSTDEQAWNMMNIPGYRTEVVWLQKGRVVNDQQFESYILSRNTRYSTLRMIFYSLVQGMKSSGRMSSEQENMQDKKYPLKISQRAAKDNIHHQSSLTVIAVSLSMGGFGVQFVGLRGLSWSVTVAQLVAVILMTILRAIIRRNLAHNISNHPILRDHELDEAALKIRSCSQWNLVTVPKDLLNNLDQSTAVISDPDLVLSIPFAQVVFKTRCQLGDVCSWDFQWQTTVDLIANAVEHTLNFICSCSDIILKGTLGDTFEWKLFVQISKESKLAIQEVDLKVSRKLLSDGRGWGDWEADKSQLRAILGLWMLDIRIKMKQNVERNRGKFACMLYLGDNSPVEIYEKWIRRQEQYEVVGKGQEFPGNRGNYPFVIGCPSILKGDHPDLVLVDTNTPLERTCGQMIFSEFMFNVVDQAVEEIGGKVRPRGGEQWLKASIGLRNEVIDELVERLEQTGLVTVGEAYRCIVPSLARNCKLPHQTDNVEKFARTSQEITKLFENGLFEQAESLLLSLLDDAECSAKGPEDQKKWNEAGHIYSRVWDTFYRIPGAEDYVSMAKEAIVAFCKRMKEDDPSTFQDMIENMRAVFEDDNMEGEKKAEKSKIWSDILDECANECANDLAVSRADHLQNQDNNSEALILACIQGNESVVAQLLRATKIDGTAADSEGRNVLHHASMRNHVLVVGILLRTDVAMQLINTKDKRGRLPLDLALEASAGAVVALLTFYGARDRNGEGKKMLEISIRNGSLAAMKATLRSQEILTQDQVYHRTAWHWAVWRGSHCALRFLAKRKELSRFVNVNGRDGLTALHLAVIKGDHSAIRLLIEGASADTELRGGSGRGTPLHLAAENGKETTVQVLIELGAEIEAKVWNGYTPLHLATVHGEVSTIQKLVQLGANKEAKDNNGCTPLLRAAMGRNDTTVQMLIDLGCDKEVTDGNGCTALHRAAMDGNDITVQKLIDLGCDKESKDSNGCTPLHRALYGSNNTVQMLIGLGCDKEAKDNDGCTPLHHATRNGEVTTVQMLIDLGCDKEGKDSNGWTPLHYAARNRNAITAQKLIDLGCEMESKDSNGCTPLHRAASSGDRTIVQKLIELGCDKEAKDKERWTPLHRAAMYGKNAIVRMLIDLGCDREAKDSNGRTPLHHAAMHENNTTVQMLITLGCDKEAKDSNGWTPLHHAASNGDGSTVQQLLDLGCDKEAKDRDGWTPLHRAIRNGRVMIFQKLIALGCDKEAKDRDGWTPLHRAAMDGNNTIVQKLIDLGCDKESKDSSGCTPLHRAASSGDHTIVQKLIELGCDKEAKDKEGWTPLHRAAMYGNNTIVQMLIDLGCDKEAKNSSNGWTSLHYAASWGSNDIVQKLVDLGCDKEAKDSNGCTPLHRAAMDRNNTTVQMLIDLGCDKEARDSNGWTPLHSAASLGSDDIVQKLVDMGADKEAITNDGSTALHIAKAKGHATTVQLLEQLGFH